MSTSNARVTLVLRGDENISKGHVVRFNTKCKLHVLHKLHSFCVESCVANPRR